MYEETKEHFAEICECIWNRILSEEKMDDETAQGMRECTAQFAMLAWNLSNIHSSLSATKKALQRFADQFYDGLSNATDPLFDAAELKWREYRDDKTTLASVEVQKVNGKPRAVAYVKGERPEDDSALKPFREFINSDSVKKRIAEIDPAHLEEEVGKLIAEYNENIDRTDIDAGNLPPLTSAEVFSLKFLKNFNKAYKQQNAEEYKLHETIFNRQQPGLSRILKKLSNQSATGEKLTDKQFSGIKDLIHMFYSAALFPCDFDMEHIQAKRVTAYCKELTEIRKRPVSQQDPDPEPIVFVMKEMDKLSISGKSEFGQKIRNTVCAIICAISEIVMLTEDIKERENSVFSFPCTTLELEDFYRFYLENTSLKEMCDQQKTFLQFQPFLSLLFNKAEDAFKKTENAKKRGAELKGSVPELILSIFEMFIYEADMMDFDESIYYDYKYPAEQMVYSYFDDKEDFEKDLSTYAEPDLLVFLIETACKYYAAPRIPKKVLTQLLAWGMAVGDARMDMNIEKYSDEFDENEED